MLQLPTCHRLLALALVAFGVACGSGEPILAPFELQPSVQLGIQAARKALEKEQQGRTPADPAFDGAPIPRMLYEIASLEGAAREAGLTELVNLGDGAAPYLAITASSMHARPEECLAACEALALLDAPLATEHLLQLCESAPPTWLRAQAAWRLGQVSADWIIPRLILRLRDEHDEATLIWVANTLALRGNGAGLDSLWRLGNEAREAEQRQTAVDCLHTLATDLGLESPRAHWQLWNSADSEERWLRRKPSAKLVLASWELIEDLVADGQAQEDADFVLSRMGTWITELLASALHDRDQVMRTKVAGVLELMGPRANRAGPTLLRSLADPPLSAAAARALGRVAYPSAEPTLRSMLQLDTQSLELRIACATALGQLNLPASINDLEACMNSEAPVELRQACASSLVALGVGKRAATFLIEALGSTESEAQDAEEALERWLSAGDEPGMRELLDAWQALASSPSGAIDPGAARARRLARQELLDSERKMLRLR